MKQKLLILLAIVVVIAIPFTFRKSHEPKADETLIVITPHNEGIRHEISDGFREWYHKKTGKVVAIDWRTPGSAGEIVKYVDSLYVNAFRLHWERELHKKWTQEVQSGFSDPRIEPPKFPLLVEPIKVAARRAFLDSQVGCGVDIFFGGGILEHKKEAEMGQLVDSGILRSNPEFFTNDIIPEILEGDRLWDAQGRWVGANLSCFGIAYNTSCLQMIGYKGIPDQWADLTDFRFFKKLAIVDPIKSTIVVRCFEMLIQQQIQQVLHELKQKHPSDSPQSLEQKAVEEGWNRSMKVIQKINANARYYTDASTQTILDVTSGNCIVGVLIDFYGYYQKEILIKRSGSSRVDFVSPVGGTTATPDPIAMFKGAQHPTLARQFIEYILSQDGQKLLSFRIGSPGGPKQFPLARTPIRKDLYADVYKNDRMNPDANPYKASEGFAYNESWTKPLFRVLGFISKVAFMDPNSELASAWKAINEAKNAGRIRDYQTALKVFEDLEPINYTNATGPLKQALSEHAPLKEIQLQIKLVKAFKKQYKQARKIAQGKHGD